MVLPDDLGFVQSRSDAFGDYVYLGENLDLILMRFETLLISVQSCFYAFGDCVNIGAN